MRGSSGRATNDFPVYPIGPVLESYGGQLVAEGYGWRQYRCPFHKDSDASGSVNTAKQVYNCHASADCPTGSATQIIMRVEGISYREAVERAETISGTSVGNLRSPSGRRGRMAGGTRSGDGVRGGRRTWRRPGASSGS